VSDPVKILGACPAVTSSAPEPHRWRPVGIVPSPDPEWLARGELPVFEVCPFCRTSRIGLYPPTNDPGEGISADPRDYENAGE
jgi:hypothetical protein